VPKTFRLDHVDVKVNVMSNEEVGLFPTFFKDGKDERKGISNFLIHGRGDSMNVIVFNGNFTVNHVIVFTVLVRIGIKENKTPLNNIGPIVYRFR
jgi:hypothetical protein